MVREYHFNNLIQLIIHLHTEKSVTSQKVRVVGLQSPARIPAFAGMTIRKKPLILDVIPAKAGIQ